MDVEPQNRKPQDSKSHTVAKGRAFHGSALVDSQASVCRDEMIVASKSAGGGRSLLSGITVKIHFQPRKK